MKFEDFLMQRSRDKQKRIDLEEEVGILQAELDDEQKLNRVLKCALHGQVVSRPSISSLLPLEVQVLLAELEMVEEEIIFLERKVAELRHCLHQEKKLNEENQLQPLLKHYCSGIRSHREQEDHEQSLGPLHYKADFGGKRLMRERKASLGSASEIHAMFSGRLNNEIAGKSRCNGRKQTQNLLDEAMATEKPNRVSEEVIICLIGIFLTLNQSSAHLNCDGLASISKLSLSCMNSKGQKSDFDGPVRDLVPYKNFIQFTRNSVDMSRVSECLPAIGKMRILMHKLSTVDLIFLTYKQKLAFWINIYNACIMNAFLQHGLPSTSDKLLTLMNKAALNVGGIILNALAIEHFILRHPYDSEKGTMDEKEMLLRKAYGLNYPEPNITFALCRGSWSSPPLRVYTAENVVNELGRAKVEYLEASVGVTSKKKIAVPKLLQWHMSDFADDMDSLLEWIYSQLPQSGSLKRSIMECLNGDGKCPTAKMVEIQPYESEFRYLLPL
ncbi:uncharacterized protein LOC122656898 isoform X2 [Telopea speciosissima]|uniref:uncharacterized protein LOC122656898 isoform X2 n=1 Tax=Telopea speciosissima TaxID=54955 RepID=UPI001CC4A5BD|nr:uncharacterized protein LOC122656898 isoform X2 [Telopea speciosissima]